MTEEATTAATNEDDDGITVLDERVSHLTEVTLSAEESLEALLDKLEEQDDVKEAKKASAASYGEKLKTIEGEINGLRDNGTVKRAYECRRIRDDRRGVLYFERLDTGERIDERPLTVAERQAELPLDEPPESKETGPCCGTCEHWEAGDQETNDGDCLKDDEEPDEGWPVTHYADHCEEWAEPEERCGNCAHYCPDDEGPEGACADGVKDDARTHMNEVCDSWKALEDGESNGESKTEPAPQSEAQEGAAAQ